MPKNNQQGFSQRLQALMHEKALSQGDLAELVGVSTATAWAWLHESVPQRRTAEVLCQKLDVGRNWLMTGTGRRSSYFSDDVTPQTANIALSFLEKFEEIDAITIRREAEFRALKKAATDLRKLAASVDRKSPSAIAAALLKLASLYESKEGLDAASKKEIRAHVAELVKRQKASGSLSNKHLHKNR